MLVSGRVQRRVMLVVATVAGSLALVPGPVSAEGLFDFFFGAQTQQARQARRTSSRNNRRLRRASPATDLRSACAAATANIFP